MSNFFTRKGDDGTTGILGNSRVSKNDPRIEALGSLDEASASLGAARSIQADQDIHSLIKRVQQDLYTIMTQVAVSEENRETFQKLNEDRLMWLEEKVEFYSSKTEIPKEFILPGDTPTAAAFSVARTVIRRAERRLVDLSSSGQKIDALLLKYLNRLSSLCFVLEIYESNLGRNEPTLSKGYR